jgi:hypothetical protein
MLITGVIHCVMYLFRFAVVYFSYGQVDLSQPVQSMYGAYTTSLPVSIGGACVLFVLLKLLVLLSLFLGIALAGILLRNLKSYFIVIFVIAGIFAGAYKMLDGNSYLSYFKWINPVSFLSVESVLFQYKNINIGGIPVSYSVLCIIISMLISAACIALGVYGCSKSDYGKIKSGCGTSVFTYEAKKMWVCQKALVICGLYLLLGIVTYKPVSDRLYTKDEISYKYYISEVEGPYTEEKMSVLQGEAKRLEDIEEKLADSAGQMDATVLDYYQNELAKAVSLQEVMNYGAYLSEKGGSFVYEKGYRMLLGKDEGRTQLLIYMVVGLALMALLTVTMLQFDKSVGMNKIIHISANRPKAQRAKQINILFAGVVVWLITFAPWIYNVLSVFGTQGIAAPAFSLRFFDRWPGFVSVGGVIGIFYGAILIYIWLSGYLANLICKYINDTITAAVLAFVISMIPIVVIY